VELCEEVLAARLIGEEEVSMAESLFLAWGDADAAPAPARARAAGGGSLRVVSLAGTRPRMEEDAEEMVEWVDSALAGLMRGTVTQSGSSVGVHGLEGLAGLGSMPDCGGWIDERAGRPFSSHHFRRSELAGGRPGSMES